MARRNSIKLVDALQALHARRVDEIVVTTMGTAREWMALGSHPHDFVLVPSSMGQAPTLGLGLAIAQPERQVVVCNGDGSMLMNLGSLVTITAAAPPNFTLLLFDNGVYEVTGAQATPGAAASRSGSDAINFAEVARACGFGSIFQFENLDDWESSIGEVLESPGPTFAHIAVTPIRGAAGPRSPSPGAARAREFAAALKPNVEGEA